MLEGPRRGRGRGCAGGDVRALQRGRDPPQAATPPLLSLASPEGHVARASFITSAVWLWQRSELRSWARVPPVLSIIDWWLAWICMVSYRRECGTWRAYTVRAHASRRGLCVPRAAVLSARLGRRADPEGRLDSRLCAHTGSAWGDRGANGRPKNTLPLAARGVTASRNGIRVFINLRCGYFSRGGAPGAVGVAGEPGIGNWDPVRSLFRSLFGRRHAAVQAPSARPPAPPSPVRASLALPNGGRPERPREASHRKPLM